MIGMHTFVLSEMDVNSRKNGEREKTVVTWSKKVIPVVCSPYLNDWGNLGWPSTYSNDGHAQHPSLPLVHISRCTLYLMTKREVRTLSQLPLGLTINISQ